jgi:hypothetical protein
MMCRLLPIARSATWTLWFEFPPFVLICSSFVCCGDCFLDRRMHVIERNLSMASAFMIAYVHSSLFVRLSTVYFLAQWQPSISLEQGVRDLFTDYTRDFAAAAATGTSGKDEL